MCFQNLQGVKDCKWRTGREQVGIKHHPIIHSHLVYYKSRCMQYVPLRITYIIFTYIDTVTYLLRVQYIMLSGPSIGCSLSQCPTPDAIPNIITCFSFHNSHYNEYLKRLKALSNYTWVVFKIFSYQIILITCSARSLEKLKGTWAAQGYWSSLDINC